MNSPPHSSDAIEARLDAILEVEFSFRDTRPPATGIARLAAPEQAYLLDWVARVASTNIELGYRYACHAPGALASMEREAVESWVLHAMDVYDREGLHAALKVMDDLDGFVRRQREREIGSVLEQVSGVLQGFLHGLEGRRLEIQAGERVHTDTETLFLPPVMARLETPRENFLLYKALLVGLWAQIRFGTFRAPLAERLARHHAPEQLLARFRALEGLRLEACIARELPGLYRFFEDLSRGLAWPSLPAAWQPLKAWAGAPEISSEMVLERVLGERELPPCPVPFHQGELDLAAVAACTAARLAREKARFRVALKLIEEELEQNAPGAGPERPRSGSRFGRRQLPDPEHPEQMRTEIYLDGRPLPLPEPLQRLIDSILLDLGEIPDDYLEPAGDGEYDPAFLGEEETPQEDVWSGTYHEEGAWLYQEWDFRRQHYRKAWCAVREKPVAPLYDGFVAATLEKYSGLVKHLRKVFEAMRDENRLLKRQSHGDEVDLDALVEALADARDGSEMSDRLFTRMHRTERNIAVLFMVDMSGSTKGWINQAERESLVLLCEALERLDDRYAIYGFSSITRKRCEIYPVKRFDQPYDAEVQARISGIQPKDYTRMGFAIRHLSKLLLETEARTRVLITLSDGKPDDYDNYRGEYGIEDTRRALIEARRNGIHPYCITIDEQARDYLPHLYGPAAYTVVERVSQLPLKISDIYRRLTT